MQCDHCGNDRAFALSFYSGGSSCDRCGEARGPRTPDVAFNKPYLDPNLPHPKRPWEKDGVWVTSKQHKSALMKEQGLHEVGDKKHGSRPYDKRQMNKAGERFGIKD